MGRRHKPNSWSVNWAVVGVAAVLTLAIGITVAMLSSGNDKRGGIVVPTPSANVPPNLVGPTPGASPERLLGDLPSTPPRPAGGTIVPSR